MNALHPLFFQSGHEARQAELIWEKGRRIIWIFDQMPQDDKTKIFFQTRLIPIDEQEIFWEKICFCFGTFLETPFIFSRIWE